MAIARVLGAHGVRGDLKIEPLAPDSCFSTGTPVLIAGTETKIRRYSTGGRNAILTVSGVRDREAARGLRDHFVQIAEDRLPPLPDGEYYRFQLIGLAVATADGGDLGTLEDVLATGATDVYIVRGPLGEVLLPATEEVIAEIDVGARTMTVRPMPGLLPD